MPASLSVRFKIADAIIYTCRKQIFRLLTAGAREKQRLQDGAFIAGTTVLHASVIFDC
eukprot:COSAG02_NODE_16_length_56207_cov_9.816122_16_plen_58_part_00